MRHPGQVLRSGTRAGIQNMLFSFTFSGFRISSANGGLVRNDGFKELRRAVSTGGSGWG